MNLIDNELEKEKEKNTKLIKIIVFVIAILVIIGIGLFSYLSYLQSKQFEFIIDRKTIQSTNYSSDLFYFEDDGDIYVSVKDFVNVLKKNGAKIEFNNGSYKDYTEDTTKCHIISTDEVAGYEINSNKMYKVLIANGGYEYYTLNEPAKSINGKIYVSKESIEIGFNVQFSYDKKSNTLRIYTLDNIVARYENKLKEEGISSKNMSFSNKKALRYGLMIVKDSGELYGVKELSTGEQLLGKKYTNLEFIESTKDFMVTTPEAKQGIMSVSGGKDIEPQYTTIKQLNSELDLYLVGNEKNKFGVYNREKQSIIIYPEYHSIGVDQKTFEIENPYILFDYCIPCKKNVDKIEKWELINIEGNRITQIDYDGLGYVKSTAKDTKGNNVLIIPEKEGIVVYKDGMYGIINSTGKQLVKTELQQVYSETSGGKEIYYIVYNGQTINLLELLENSNSSQNDKGGEVTNNNETGENTVDEKTTNNTTQSTTVDSSINNTTSSKEILSNTVNNTVDSNKPSTKNATN